MRGWLIKRVINMSFTICCLCVIVSVLAVLTSTLSIYIEDNEQILVEDWKD